MTGHVDPTRYCAKGQVPSPSLLHGMKDHHASRIGKKSMYKNFFGLKEKPFKLVPNPAYLFLSRSHEEALAHLEYTILQADGFVLITGEVGTGKTTLCRAFLDNLDETIEAAYIFNPNLDSLQLLRAINDEFGIDSECDNTKDLIDGLNTFLMEKRAEKHIVILLIDEAQNLSKAVLEQLRLLSNLETNTSKLIQIILVGQPELGKMLETYELRQLGQRITLHCHLDALTFKEMIGYIQHRIHIAAQRPAIQFSRSALKVIYKYSGGIPRLINIACDRALLTAFGLNRRHISLSTAKSAIKELSGREVSRRKKAVFGNGKLYFLASLCAVLIFTIAYGPGGIISHTDPGRAGEDGIRTAENIPAEQPVVTGEPTKIEAPLTPVMSPAVVDSEPVQNIDTFIRRMDPVGSRRKAFKAILDLWLPTSRINPHLDGILRDNEYFRIAAKQNGLLVLPIRRNLDLVGNLGLPVIIGLKMPDSPLIGYLILSKIESDRIVLKGGIGQAEIEADAEALEARCSNTMYVVWKDFYALGSELLTDTSTDSIVTLKTLLSDAGFNQIEISPVYDEVTENIVRKIQGEHGIEIDGIVGPFTKIALYNQVQSLNIPHIVD